MTTTQLVLVYLAVSGLVAILGATLAVDRNHSMQVRSAGTWVALLCLVWPVSLVALGSVALGALLRHRRPEQEHAAAPVVSGLSHHH